MDRGHLINEKNPANHMYGGHFSQMICDKISKLFKNLKVLEICAGSGRCFRYLKQKGMDIIATDIRPNNWEGIEHNYQVVACDAIHAVHSYSHSVLLVIHPMRYSNLNTPNDYLTPVILADPLANYFIIVLEYDDMYEYAQRCFFKTLLKNNWFVTEQFRHGPEYMLILKQTKQNVTDMPPTYDSWCWNKDNLEWEEEEPFPIYTDQN